MSILGSISKADSRLLLAVLILLSDIICPLLLFYWGIPYALIVPQITAQYVGAAQMMFSGLTPLVALAWQWYFSRKSASSTSTETSMGGV